MSLMLIRKTLPLKATTTTCFFPQDTENSDAKRPLKGQLREPGQVLLVSFVFKNWMPQSLLHF